MQPQWKKMNQSHIAKPNLLELITQWGWLIIVLAILLATILYFVKI